MDAVAGSRWNAGQRREFWIFLTIAFLLLAAGIGLRDPWPADEPRFALVAKQMVESGNWLIPHRGSELYSDKPPLFMAMQALFYTLTREWRIAFLLPSLLSGLGMLVLTYDLARRLWNHRVGLYAATALLCTLQFVYQIKRAQIDPSVSFFLTLANYGLLRHFLLGPNWRMYWLGCFAAGLGVITKGVGVLALLMFLPYLFARWRDWTGVARPQAATLRWLAGAVFFLLAIALWLVPMLVTVQQHDTPQFNAYVHDILYRQTAGRYTDSWDHQQPAWYYLEVMLFSWLPMTLAWPWVVPMWWRQLRLRDARILLPLAWTLLLVIFFSCSRGKRDVYIMPALPLVAVLCGPWLASLTQRQGFRRLLLGFVLLLGVLFVGIGIAAWGGHLSRANTLVEQRGLEAGGAALWGFVVAIGAAALLSAALLRVRRSPQAVLVTLAGIWLAWSLWAYPVLNESTSAIGVMQQAGKIIGPDAELGLVGWKEQNLLNADRPARDFGFTQAKPRQLAAAAQWLAERPQRRWVFILETAMGACVDRSRGQYVGHANRREWWLIQSSALRVGCDPSAAPTATEDSEADANAE